MQGRAAGAEGHALTPALACGQLWHVMAGLLGSGVEYMCTSALQGALQGAVWVY